MLSFFSFNKRWLQQKLLWVMLLCSSYAGAQEAGLQIQFEHSVGNLPLALDKTYTNDFNEAFTVNRFRYYISRVTLSDTTQGLVHQSDQHYLVKEGEDDSKTINITLSPGRYNRLQFLLGVDSVHNVSGAQSGALDPLHGMFWTWKTGYIMAKLEGRSPASTVQRQMFEYHIGGFGGEHSVLQTVSLPLDLVVVKGKTAIIAVEVDLNSWFNGIHRLSIAEHPACTTISPLAKQFSENYRTMFAIQNTRSE